MMYMIMYAEVFKDGVWHKVDKCFKSAYPAMQGQLTDRVCDEYNPILFELFTGIHQSQNKNLTKIDIIAKTDGLPTDVSSDIADKTSILLQSNYNGAFLTLSDLINYNWDAYISEVGIISEWQYKRLKKDCIWPANINRRVLYENSKVISPFEMDMILKDKSLRDCDLYYVRFEYNAMSITDRCKFFCEEAIPALIKLTPKNGSYDDVRIVYVYKES